METILELKKKVKAIDLQIAQLRGEKNEVMKELKGAMQAAFETQHKIKSGDPIKTKNETVFYDRFTFDAFGDIVILCHPQKKDGTASKAIRYYNMGQFQASDCNYDKD